MPKKQLIGTIVSDKMQKTVVVAVKNPYHHPIYKKLVKRTNRFKAHDELGAKIGDVVRIVETRPLSKEKRWRVVEILKSNED